MIRATRIRPKSFHVGCDFLHLLVLPIDLIEQCVNPLHSRAVMFHASGMNGGPSCGPRVM
jgi:hypothetical protein